MARDWIEAQLHNWGRWLQEGAGHARGYPTVNILQMQRGGAASVDVVAVSDVEARKVHQAVAALQFTSSNLHMAICARYVGNPHLKMSRRRQMSHAEIGALCNVTEQTSRAWVVQAENLIDAALRRAE